MTTFISQKAKDLINGNRFDQTVPIQTITPADTTPNSASVNEEILSKNETGYDASSDIAVVGMACRVAGGNDSPEKLWDFLMSKKDGSGEIPPLRWEPYLRRDARNAKVLAQTTSRGYFVQDLENFDSTFFGVSPREAEMMDPQQRISLEVCWEALEDAGIPPQTLAGSNTAVFMGVNSDDYSKALLEDLPGIEAWMGIGTAFCGIPNRISYHLDLMGPSTAVDAACASSLVAIHHGRQSLLQGETNLAIVGGVNAMCGPGLTRVLDKAGAISPEGFCRSFDDEAKGYGRGEGAAVIILKRLEDAVQDSDRILAVLKGSAVAQDGRTNGIMAPNGKAQELVAHNALQVAGVDPLTIGYVEAHATSTPVGDPVEINAIAGVYGKGRNPDTPCYVGSIKPNIGHLEAGAGAMGFIKAVMAVNKAVIPPQANFNKPNSKVDWDTCGVQVVRDPTPWPKTDVLRRAGICSYGYGGTVSHAVIEEYLHNDRAFPAPGIVHSDVTTPSILLLSAPQEKRLAPLAKKHQMWIVEDGANSELASIATTLATRRGHHDYRAAFVVHSHEDAAECLKSFSEGSSRPWITSSRVLDNNTSKDCIWVFSGHGAQWQDMGKELLSTDVFYRTIASIDPIVQTEMGFSALNALECGEFETSDRVQVLTYVMQIGLAAVLHSKGLTPQAVVGHSIGEIAASVVAGALSAEEGALIVCRRAVLYREVMGQGAMVLVHCPYKEIEQEIGAREDIAAAIDSSPSSCVVSGATDVVTKYAEAWKARGIKVLRVKSDVAFHSPVLNKLVEPLYKRLQGDLTPKAPSIKLYSTSLADPRGQNIRDVEYWANNMTKPVRLTQAIDAAAEDGLRIFLEVSSHPIVSHSVEETLTTKGLEDHTVIPTMIRGKPTQKSILYSLGQLHCQGASVNWKMSLPGPWSYSVPTTTWNHQPCWRKIETGGFDTARTHDVDHHSLLGQRVPVFGEDMTIFTTQLDNNTKPFPGSHPLHGTEIVPAAVLVNTFFYGTGKQNLSDIVLRVPVAISAPRDVQVVVRQGQVKIISRLIQGDNQTSDDQSWVTHTTGRFPEEETTPVQDGNVFIDVAAVRTRIGSKLKDNFSIEYLAGVGVSAMGFPWAVTEHYGNEKEMIARVDTAPDVTPGSSLPWDAKSWAPILDAATSIGSTLFFKEPRLRMPAQIDRVMIRNDVVPPKIGYIYVQEASGTELAVNVHVLDESGMTVATFQAMRFAEIEGTLGASGSVESLVHQVSWPPVSLAEEPLSFGNTSLVAPDIEVGEIFEKSLKKISTSTARYLSVEALLSRPMTTTKDNKIAAIVYVPPRVESFGGIPTAANAACKDLLDLVKYAAGLATPTKVFAITNGVTTARTPTALSQAPLHGLARIIASEQPDLWGALIDNEDEDEIFPLLAVKYVHGADVVRMHDGVPRTARLRRLPREKLQPHGHHLSLLPRPHGTYLISGGLGALGLEVANFLVENGARRLVLVSRRPLPPRHQWGEVQGLLRQATEAIENLEKLGATVHVVSVDLSAEESDLLLKTALDALALPPVNGVIHAAGVLEDELILNATADSFNRVLAPKVSGGLALHRLYPVKSLDFFVLFSSCGQLFGFPGQGSYASGNAFLDALATNRRNQGDNSIAIQWTSWRGMGMAASTDFINAELESKGITDVTRYEAFRAWGHLSKYNIDHGVVLRSRVFEHDEPLPVPILADIAVRKPPSAQSSGGEGARSGAAAEGPKSGPALREYLDKAIRGCVVKVLQLSSIDDVEPRSALSDLGMDSVMTVGLRRQLQQAMGINVPPTLTWSHPTVSHLLNWFMEKLEKE